jgi:hypothetical protein
MTKVGGVVGPVSVSRIGRYFNFVSGGCEAHPNEWERGVDEWKSRS